MKQTGFDPMESIIKYIKRYGAIDNFFLSAIYIATVEMKASQVQVVRKEF